jgi:hypothetical protein
VNYTTNTWDTGFVANIVVRNGGSTAIDGWTLRFSFPGNQRVSNAWNAAPSGAPPAVVLTNLSYNSVITANGGTQSMGFQGTYSGTNANPTAFTLNGTACTLF